MHLFSNIKQFKLENEAVLLQISIAIHIYGNLKIDKSKVFWTCNALTSNSNAEAWWPGVIGENGFADPSKYFIVCANIIGSCYGSTGPLTIDPLTNKSYFSSFPMVTVRDMVNAHILLREH